MPVCMSSERSATCALRAVRARMYSPGCRAACSGTNSSPSWVTMEAGYTSPAAYTASKCGAEWTTAEKDVRCGAPLSDTVMDEGV